MPVTQAHQAHGTWTVSLVEDTPNDIVASYAIETQGFGHVCILPCPYDPSWTRANVLAMSLYTGLYRRTAGITRRNVLSGSHASAWLGDAQGDGPDNLLQINAALTFPAFVNAIRSPGLTAGTVTDPIGAGITRWGFYDLSNMKTPRQAIEEFAALFSATTEWEVTDGLKLNGGDAAQIYGATPTTLITPWMGGTESGYVALRAVVGWEGDVEDYSRNVLAHYGTRTILSVTGANQYTDGQGAPLDYWRMTKTVSASGGQDTVANAQFYADSTNAAHNMIRTMLTVRTDSETVLSDVRCGSNVWIYHPAVGVYDSTNPLSYHGETVWPVIKRVESMTVPITKGMAVVFVPGSGLPTDLSRFVRWESPGATLQIGAQIRPLPYVRLGRG